MEGMRHDSATQMSSFPQKTVRISGKFHGGYKTTHERKSPV